MRLHSIHHRLLLPLLLAFAFSVSLFAQTNITVTGTVTDNTGEPILGASIIQKGTSNGVVSDLDGHFTLTVPQGTTLSISYIGFTSQEVKAAPNLQIKLKESARGRVKTPNIKILNSLCVHLWMRNEFFIFL